MPDFEIAVVGAGVIGLAIASRLSEKHKSLVVLEKNEKYGLETSSRNSEVIHAGIDFDKAGYGMVFAKGSYFSVSSSKAKLVSRLVYPVPHKETLVCT